MAIDRVKVRKEAEKYQQAGRIDKAVDCYRMLVDDDPKNLALQNSYGDLLAQANRPSEAVEVFRRLAIAYERDGFAPKATAVLKKAVRSAPDDMDLMQRLADLYRQTGMIRDAVATHLQVAEQFQKKGLVKRALEEFGKVVDLDPKNLKNKVKLADLFNKEGMKDQAASIYLEVAESLGMEGKAAEAMQIVERAKAMTSTPQLFLSQSRLAVMASDYTGAAGALREGLKSNSRSVELLEALAEIELRANNPDRAMEALAQVPQLPEKDLALCERALKQMVAAGRGEEGLRLFAPLGRELARRGMGDTVTRSVVSATKERPSVDAWLYLAEVAQQSGNKNEQIYALQNAHQLATTAGDTRAIASIKAQLAEVGATPDDQPLSRPDAFTSSSGFFPSMSGGHPSGEYTRHGETEIDPMKRLKVEQFTRQGEAFARSGSLDRAVEAYKQALALDPANFPLIEIICGLHRQSGLITRVQQQYLQSAQTVHGMGKLKEATYLLDKAEQLFPGSTRIHRRTMGLPDFNAQAATMQPVPPAAAPAPPPVPTLAAPTVPLAFAPDAIIPLDLPDLDQAPAIGGFNSSAPTPPVFALPPAMEAIPMPPPMEAMPPAAMPTMPLPPMPDIMPVPMLPAAPEPAALSPGDLSWMPLPAVPERPSLTMPMEPEAAMPMAAGMEIPDKLQDLLSDIDFQLDYGSPEEAKAEIDGALEQFPGHPELTNRLAKAEDKLLKLGHGSKAQALGEEDFANSFFDLTDVLGSALEDSGEGEEMHDATKVVDKVQSVDELFDAFRMGVEEQVKGDDYDTHYNLGIAYKEMMLIDPAIDEFKKVLRDPERTLECCSMLSICEQARGNFDAAMEWLVKGIKAPGFPPEDSIGLRYDLGEMYLQTGDKAAALQEYRQVYDLDPDYRDVASRIA
ncbi:MAG TPA: tetratricopeptide repeat protein [Holophagaceae bacterium]|jgi:tetratricopeptide (TPR) repeat protein|nr:tetratricopeptide repeat protein [Holophagaceae bacterium]